jgi:DnaJ-class molecular chaperone
MIEFGDLPLAQALLYLVLMAQKDYYDILGVARKASEAEIKKAYRGLAKKHHPDVNKDNKASEEKFKEVQEAYDVLGDKKKREQYDMFGPAGAAAGAGGFGGGGPYYYSSGSGGAGVPPDFDFSSFFGGGRASAGGSSQTYRGEDAADLFGDLFGMGGFGKGKGRRTGRGPAPGADRYYTMEIDFLEAALGKTSKISVPEGNKTTHINVKIPPGVDTGSKIRLAGQGEASPNGGKAGDLYIEVRVHPHPFFTRQGEDIYLNVPITVGEAVNGASIEVPTIDGSIHMKVPPGTQGGQKFRLKGKGVAHPKGSGRGDQFVVAEIQVPKDIGEDGKKLIREFEEKYPLEPRKHLF